MYVDKYVQERDAKLSKMDENEKEQFLVQEKYSEWCKLAKSLMKQLADHLSKLERDSEKFGQLKKKNKWLPEDKLVECKKALKKMELHCRCSIM